MKVKYVHGRVGVCSSNILWAGKFPMRGGKFPATHPCGATEKPMVRLGEMTTGDTPLDRFRARGYWASCFPEGDGMTLEVGARTRTQVMADIRECFGWEVE